MHIPVLLSEVLAYLNVQAGGTYVDGTFGRGGHTRAILEQGGKVIGFDMDPDAAAFAQKNFSAELESGALRLVPRNFAEIDDALTDLGITPRSLSGALFDFGMSSNQIDESKRGFSFQKDEPLDMRMNPELGVTAADLLNALPEKHLQTLLWENAQETAASAIARAVVARRAKQPFRTTRELADLVSKVKGGRHGSHLHPATKVFQALRIAVNTENENLSTLLSSLLKWMNTGARLVFISFHEGEDRAVKLQVKDWEAQGKVNVLTQKVVMPSETEIKKNPRSRSAKLRAVEVL